jgi:hypothetical protein
MKRAHFRVGLGVVGAISLLAGAATAQPPRARPATPPGGTDGPGWSDAFDAYAAGSQLVPQGGWQAWPGYPAGNPTAFVSNTQASSAPNSCRVATPNPSATPPADETDVVHTYAITGGHWIYRIKTYYPSTATFTTAPYFILLNTYSTSPVAFDWSVQLRFNRASGTVLADNVSDSTSGSFSAAPIVLDQWVEVVADIDLAAGTSGRFSLTYGGAPIATNCDWNAGGPLPGRLQAAELYNDGVSTFFFDDASLTAGGQPPPCYANCDGSTINPCLNVGDFGCFLNRFAAGDTYANCDGSTIVPVLTVQDFGCFLNSFAAGCNTC